MTISRHEIEPCSAEQLARLSALAASDALTEAERNELQEWISRARYTKGLVSKQQAFEKLTEVADIIAARSTIARPHAPLDRTSYNTTQQRDVFDSQSNRKDIH